MWFRTMFLSITTLGMSLGCGQGQKPNGFMGVAWGTSLNEVRSRANLEFVDQDQFLKTATFQSSVHQWKGIPLQQCNFSFYEDKFYAVSMVIEGQNNSDLMVQLIQKDFGKGQSTADGSSRSWQSYGSLVHFYFHSSSNAGLVDFMSPFYSAKIQRHINDYAANSGVEDF